MFSCFIIRCGSIYYYMSYYVYIHTCPNSKRYIGIHEGEHPQNRWGYNGIRYKSQLFYRAIKKYGWSNIIHDIYEVDSQSEMFYLEKYLIRFYNTTNILYGYNVSTGGDKGSNGCIPWNKGLKGCQVAWNKGVWRSRYKVNDIIFNSCKLASEFIGVKPQALSTAAKNGYKIKGYTVVKL